MGSVGFLSIRGQGGRRERERASSRLCVLAMWLVAVVVCRPPGSC